MIKLDNKTMKKTQMSLQIVIMNTLIAIIKVEQFVDSIPGCSHLYRMVGCQPGDSKVDDYPTKGSSTSIIFEASSTFGTATMSACSQTCSGVAS
jgi:hypothetical protein